ncbi:3-hydroxyacyl-CoA dehydrogenase NAD-binding domain-containing protein [Subtercola lobariae]|uniref:3-hydroxyacyl-CoA dehydrogenase n=1 Tax=Subtercola lobariae TaxID=1588641 RepID=A0A917B5C3_9MICO|nr:3-hydroxyacyl-CoA dehydrogenase NAD-binding domain-containing protein [Subtercola lobariae]GGF21612.1 hypothetical protein GCM10011399_14160 [Subtercola lobariae]
MPELRPTTLTVTTRTEVLPGRQLPSYLIDLQPASPSRPVIWGESELAALIAAVPTTGEFDAVVLIGSPGTFAAGADLSSMSGIGDHAEAVRVAGRGFDAIEAITGIPSPTFTVLTGAARGGGLELALSAATVFARPDAGPFALPEVGLGLLPGWGGSAAVARRAGQAAALDIAVRQPLRGGAGTPIARAVELGLIDAVIPAPADDPAGWDAAWRQWVGAALAAADDSDTTTGTGTGTGTGTAASTSDNTPETSRAAAATTTAPTTGTATTPSATDPAFATALADPRPAVRLAAQLVLDVPTSTPAEVRAATTAAFADALMTNEARASMYSRELVRSRSKKPKAGAEATAAGGTAVRTAGVVGAGLMASQLATLLIQFGRIPVTITDLDDARVEKGIAAVRDRLDRLSSRGKIAADDLPELKALISGTTDVSALADADFVIEAVFENLQVKRGVFANLEKHLSPTALLATNTSSLSIDQLAEGLAHPERVVGFHVFNPVGTVPLLEVVRGTRTSDETVETATSLARRLDRVPVLVADKPGFVVNRLLTRMYSVVLGAVDDGLPIEAADAALAPLALPMTPIALLQFVGPAVQLHVCETMAEAYPDRFRVPQCLANLVEHDVRELLTRDARLTDSAREYFVAATAPAVTSTSASASAAAASTATPAATTSTLTEGAPAAAVTPSAASATVSTPEFAPENSPEPPADLLTAVLDAWAEEAAIMLDEGAAHSAEDIDLCMILGANYPPHLGGLTPLLDRTGAAERMTGLRFHPAGVASLPA